MDSREPTVKAVWYEKFGGPEVLRWVDLDAPTAGPGEVRIQVRTSAVNPVDHVMRRGFVPNFALPSGVGMDAAGVVDQVGAGVTDVVVGDAVFGMTAGPGALAEYTVLGHWAKKPASIALGGSPCASAPSSQCPGSAKPTPW